MGSADDFGVRTQGYEHVEIKEIRSAYKALFLPLGSPYNGVGKF